VVGKAALLIYRSSMAFLIEYMFWNDFHFDGLTLAYLTTGFAMTLLAVWNGSSIFRGRRQWSWFVCTVMLFGAGYGLAVFSGDWKTLLLGWEIMGAASFLLIILHRDFSGGIPAKAFFIYRMGDTGLLLAMWASLHPWRHDTTIISLLLLATASLQASQLPFSSWLPQALENTTTASAVLLTTLTMQMGAFLLLRTYPYWEHQLSVRILMALLGLVAAAMAAGFARVQSSVKRRVAYVSMAHNGLIFIEVAAGFKSLALIHIAANAFLGAYRLLVQPSVVVSGAGAGTASNRKTWEDRLPKKLKYTIYMLYTREWGLYARFSRYLRS
jgi:NADH:ubiquinone oxidoreductase subunit 5 (subunit L)/multisubunit Na+/H+ antiporter MnhA subunit